MDSTGSTFPPDEERINPVIDVIKAKRLKRISDKKKKGIALARADMLFLLSEMSLRNETLLAECRALRNRLARYENGIIIPAGVKL